MTKLISQLDQLLSLKSGSKRLIVEFFSPNVKPSIEFLPTSQKLASKSSKWTFARVNCLESKELCREMKVTAAPTFLVFVEGLEVDRFVGADEAVLKQKLESF